MNDHFGVTGTSVGTISQRIPVSDVKIHGTDDFSLLYDRWKITVGAD
jgi:hypothetical protein